MSLWGWRRGVPQPPAEGRRPWGKQGMLLGVLTQHGKCNEFICSMSLASVTPALATQPGNVSSLTSFARREWSQLWQHPISQAARIASPRWLLAVLADISMRGCWASAFSTRGRDVKPTTHLCHRTCQPSQCDRCTATAGGTSREGTPAYARTPRSTRPPSLDHTCGRTGHSSIIKSKQELEKSWLCAVQGSHRQRCSETLPRAPWTS